MFLRVKKGNGLSFVFSLQIQSIRKLKDILSWQIGGKKQGSNLTRLNKTHRRKGAHQTERKPEDDREGMQTHHQYGFLLEYGSVSIPVSRLICLSFYVFHNTLELVLHHCITSSGSPFTIGLCVVIKNLFSHYAAQHTQKTPQFPHFEFIMTHWY